MKRLEVERASVDDIVQSVNVAVEKATAPLRDRIDQLNDEIREHRSVVTHREAVRYFGYEVKARRVKDFILGRNLPEGVEVPLPANRLGHTYYIETDTLMRWQAGRVTEDELYDWQTERTD